MATITQTITLRDQMTATLKKIEAASKNTEQAFKGINDQLDKMDSASKKVSSSTASMFKEMLVANLAASAISKLANIIMGELGNAVKRFDIMSNYNNVMSNLGVSIEDAEASRQRLSEGLKGLPTTLDTAALAVQRFTASNGDVRASTEMYLAMNNALLAGGTSAELQASAMEQLAQAYSKGKPDMMEWRALLQAMPGQLKQIATAMGKSTSQLGEDLRSGKTSMNEFLKTVVMLNKEGIDGFENFQKQAENATGGIQTAVSNLKASIDRGWIAMIENANKSLEASGLPNIQTIIKNLGIAIEEVMTHIGKDLLPSLGEGLNTLAQQVSQFTKNTNDNVNKSASAWDYFMIVFNRVKLGFLFGMAMLQIGAMTVILGIVSGFEFLAQGIVAAISTAVHFVQDGVNSIIGLLNMLIDGFNAVGAGINAIFGEGTVGVAARIDEATFADDFDAYANTGVAGITSAKNDLMQGIKNTVLKTREWNNDTVSNLLADENSRLNPTNVEKATEENIAQSEYNWDKFNDTINSVTGSDGSGGKALKVTSNDDLLSDDDIKLLLDVATRDYKLNYQQVTPNVTLTFGDIRETADVDDILDQVADRLEEIYDSNLEVVTT